MGFEKAYIEFSDHLHAVQGSAGVPGTTEGFF